MNILSQIQKDFEQFLSESRFNDSPVELYDPVNYLLNIGGKRLRPAVLLLSTYLFSGKYQHAMPAAFAVEVFHNFTLAHDDIMDNAEVRRGKPTLHEKYSVNAGILSGDVMLVHAYKSLLKLKDADRVRIFDEFTKFAIEVCEGQQMDMNFETSDSITIPEYLKMIELKTSVLVAGAMKIGAIIGKADEKSSNAIYEFGRNLGIAFQLQDDLLDAYGDPNKFGKKRGGDIVQNKKTFLFLKAIELCSNDEHRLLANLYADANIKDDEKIEQVMEIFNRLNISHHTEMLKEQYWNKAIENLRDINAPVERKNVLEKFATALMSREV